MFPVLNISYSFPGKALMQISASFPMGWMPLHVLQIHAHSLLVASKYYESIRLEYTNNTLAISILKIDLHFTYIIELHAQDLVQIKNIAHLQGLRPRTLSMPSRASFIG